MVYGLSLLSYPLSLFFGVFIWSFTPPCVIIRLFFSFNTRRGCRRPTVVASEKIVSPSNEFTTAGEIYSRFTERYHPTHKINTNHQKIQSRKEKLKSKYLRIHIRTISKTSPNIFCIRIISLAAFITFLSLTYVIIFLLSCISIVYFTYIFLLFSARIFLYIYVRPS